MAAACSLSGAQAARLTAFKGPRYHVFGNQGGVRFIVLSRQLLCPQEQVDAAFDPAHSVKKAADLRPILEKSGLVVAAFAGHCHDGGYMKVNGTRYVCLQADAAYGNDASYHNQYATVDVYRDGESVQVAVAGNGNQRSYALTAAIK
jgi:hypothetical protein